MAIHILSIVISCFISSGCALILTPAERTTNADKLANHRQWHRINLDAGDFTLAAYIPNTHTQSSTLTIYIEGDGSAWVSPTQPSTDPTPIDPVALRLALAQPQGNAAYLARPCQFTDAVASHCSDQYWLGKRFSLTVVNATNQAINQLKRKFVSRQIYLVGYSGGGAIAALVAARRDDVIKLITIAGNLNHRLWTERHHVSELAGSLNPADEINQLSRIEQWHFVGTADRDIQPEIIKSFVDQFPNQQKIHFLPIADFDHHCCWAEKWPELFKATNDHP